MFSIFFEFFDKDFPYVIAMKLAKLYYQAVFPKLISKIYLFLNQVFHDVAKFKILKLENLNISRTKKALEVKQKTVFLVSRVFFFRLKKQNSKNKSDITSINFSFTSVTSDFGRKSALLNKIVIQVLPFQMNYLLGILLIRLESNRGNSYLRIKY